MKNFSRAYAAVALTGASMAVLIACGASHGTGTITPVGTAHGTFRYCSYTPDSDGIEISHHEATPCVVGDTRSKKDRKKKTSTTIVPVRPGTTTASATARTSVVPSTAKTAPGVTVKPGRKLSLTKTKSTSRKH